ncbi:hypothetical protein [Dysgonomonas macrotermitis]|uniref:Uncharacterized protein n=1 Tax=Dysgonomonas macrotermitis TaxID=1346286 RepID=A0A1M4ZAM9_9BACT|nr:hypothetical protein [Dysgonomonas macrotermitis]SHF15064.1 hypothetical protein SAMN05444362_10432 [Dysgonomonas macrotermitis]
MKIITLFTQLLLLTFTTMSCKPSASAPSPDTSDSLEVNRRACNSVYYWKTTFSLTDEDRNFLTGNRIGRIYIRYFDVYQDPDNYRSPIPEATIRFKDTVPAGLEVVPTVFIDNELFKMFDMNDYAGRLVNRIRIMSETNDIPNISEVQIDCDWTATTEGVYFRFLRKVDTLLLKDGIRLSATIRLHQLNMEVPPVHRGVLMCYNTGAVRHPGESNSILRVQDVKPYASRVEGYKLPMDIAYPAFSWAVLFREGKFQSLLRTADRNNPNLKLKGNHVYRVEKGFYVDGAYLAPGDEIRFEDSHFEDIIGVKKLLEHQLSGYSVIMYHLDSRNLSKYTQDEIDRIYRRR